MEQSRQRNRRVQPRQTDLLAGLLLCCFATYHVGGLGATFSFTEARQCTASDVRGFPGRPAVRRQCPLQPLRRSARCHRLACPRIVRHVGSLMAPLGPFCPFVSPSFLNLQPSSDMAHRARMEHVVNRVDQIMQENQQDPSEQLRLGKELRELDAVWRANLFKMRHADDFQTMELYYFTRTHLQHLGVSIEDVEKFATWQADVLEALGSRSYRLPTPPVDPSSTKSTHVQGVLDSIRLGSTHTMSFDLAPPSKTAASEVVQEELQHLERDHRELIDMGQGYGTFDREGKMLYMDQMAKLQERWDVYLARFQLMGEMAPGYVSGADTLLKRLGLTADLARQLIKEAHDSMRKAA